MRKIRVDKAGLTQKVSINRDEHARAYEAARDGYAQALTDAAVKLAQEITEATAEDIIAMVQNPRNRGGTYGDPRYRLTQLPVPEGHVEDYDRVLEMLSWSQDDTIELDENEFRHYVQDDWEWKAVFAQTSATYSGS